MKDVIKSVWTFHRSGMLTLLWIGIVVSFLYFLHTVVVPFLVAALLAYMLDPVVSFLVRQGISRSWAVVFVFLIFFSVLFVGLFFLIPGVLSQIKLLKELWPVWLSWLQEVAKPYLENKLSMSPLFDPQALQNMVSDHLGKTSDILGDAWTVIATSGMRLIRVVVNFLLTGVVLFYLLRDWPVCMEKIKAILPKEKKEQCLCFFRESHEVLGAFLRGQLMVMGLLMLFYGTCLWGLGVRFSLLIGWIIGLLSVVPFLGSIIGWILVSLMVLLQFHSLLYLGFTVLIFVVGHVLEGMVLTPWLIGDRIGLHPVAVIFAILAGGECFGILGILLALPVAAILLVLFRHIAIGQNIV